MRYKPKSVVSSCLFIPLRNSVMMAGNMAAISNQEAISMTMKTNMLRAPEKKIEDLVSGNDFGLPPPQALEVLTDSCYVRQILYVFKPLLIRFSCTWGKKKFLFDIEILPKLPLKQTQNAFPFLLPPTSGSLCSHPKTRRKQLNTQNVASLKWWVLQGPN